MIGMRVLLVINAREAPAGQVADRIAARGGEIVEVFPHEAGAPPLPKGADGFSGMVVLGGKQDAFDDAGFPAFADEMRLIRAFDAAGVPVLGICLGAQLIARAFGARVFRMGSFERGLVEMRRTGACGLLANAGAPLRLMSWHQDTFDLPDGAELFLSSDACPRQGFRAGRACTGFQCHVEATPEIARGWMSRAADPDAPDLATLRADLATGFTDSMRDGAAIIDAWLDSCG